MKKVIWIMVAAVVLGAFVFAPAPSYGLGQRTVVRYIRAIAADLELTPAQVDNLTKQQAATYILQNYPTITAAKLKEAEVYWDAIKVMLRNDALARQLTGRRMLLRQQLLNAYPNAICLDTDYAKDLADRLIPLLYAEVDPNEIN
jgi:hypothetical protein